MTGRPWSRHATAGVPVLVKWFASISGAGNNRCGEAKRSDSSTSRIDGLFASGCPTARVQARSNVRVPSRDRAKSNSRPGAASSNRTFFCRGLKKTSDTSPLFNEFAAFHDDHAVANLTGNAQIVRDEEHSNSGRLLNVVEQLEDLPLNRHIEC
jgi:hypothetical protein